MTRPRILPVLGVGLVALTLFVACDGEVATPKEPTITPGSDTQMIGIVIPEDEVVLNAHLFGAQNSVAVILSHMRRNDQSGWFEFAERLADEGYAALTYDFRGYGESTGDQAADKLDDDLEAALHYMQDTGGYKTIFLVGASMGGTASLVVSAEEEVAGVVAISAPSEFEEQNALEAVPRITEPKLFVASEDDTAAMLSLEELSAAARDPKDSQTYAGNAHGTDLLLSEHAAAFQQRILDFLRQNGGS